MSYVSESLKFKELQKLYDGIKSLKSKDEGIKVIKEIASKGLHISNKDVGSDVHYYSIGAYPDSEIIKFIHECQGKGYSFKSEDGTEITGLEDIIKSIKDEEICLDRDGILYDFEEGVHHIYMKGDTPDIQNLCEPDSNMSQDNINIVVGDILKHFKVPIKEIYVLIGSNEEKPDSMIMRKCDDGEIVLTFYSKEVD